MLEHDIQITYRLADLQDRYIHTLDSDALEDWPTLFVDDCLYEVIPKENEDAGLPAPVMRYDNIRMLHDRVISLRHANIYQKPVYRHFLSGMRWLAGADGLYRMTTNYLVINTNQTGQSLVYQTGTYHDTVVVEEDGVPRFKSKRVIYDTSRVQTLLAVPI